MRNLIKIFLSVTIITILIIFSDKVNALEVISKEIFEYIENMVFDAKDYEEKNTIILEEE